MEIRNRIKQLISKNNQEQKAKNNQAEQPEEFEIIINDIDTFALYLKNRRMPYILIKDKNFPFMLNDPDLEWIDMNKENFDYYGEFYNFPLMFEKIQKLHDLEVLAKKTEDDYLKDYLHHCTDEYPRIMKKMELLEIDGKQYIDCINQIKAGIKDNMNNLLENYINSNRQLKSNRTYKEIKEGLIGLKEFKQKYPLYRNIMGKEGHISHCGYPDYMWQSGAERNIYNLR